MIKRDKTISINIISVFLILMSVFIVCVGQVNAWFSSEHHNGIQIVAQIGTLKLKLYQTIGTTDYEIKTYGEKEDPENPKHYVQLNKKIEPDENVTLNIKLANEDQGSTSMYVRFKFEIYARRIDADELIPIEISGMQQADATKSGFVKNETDGFYYLKDNLGNYVVLKSAKQLTKEAREKDPSASEIVVGETVQLLTGFKIPFSSFVYESGESRGQFKLGSDTIYIKITVDAQIAEWPET